MDVGEPISTQFGETDRAVVASGTSCTEQIDALLGSNVKHPIQVVAPPE